MEVLFDDYSDAYFILGLRALMHSCAVFFPLRELSVSVGSFIYFFGMFIFSFFKKSFLLRCIN